MEKNIKLYRLKHKPTGLYFTPSKGNGNLSKKGKIYINRIPSLDWVKNIRIKIFNFKKDPSGINKMICEFFNIDYNKGFVDKYVKSNIDDWIIEEYKE